MTKSNKNSRNTVTNPEGWLVFMKQCKCHVWSWYPCYCFLCARGFCTSPENITLSLSWSVMAVGPCTQPWGSKVGAAISRKTAFVLYGETEALPRPFKHTVSTKWTEYLWRRSTIESCRNVLGHFDLYYEGINKRIELERCFLKVSFVFTSRMFRDQNFFRHKNKDCGCGSW